MSSKKQLDQERQNRKLKRVELFEDRMNFDLMQEAQMYSLECRAEILKGVKTGDHDVDNERVDDLWDFIRGEASYPLIKVFADIVLSKIGIHGGIFDDDLKDASLREWDIVRGKYKENND